jgi:transposase
VEGVRLSPDIRGTFNRLLKKGLEVTRIADLFDTSRQTVYGWTDRAKHVGREYYKDRMRKPRKFKVTVEVELSILKLRTTFKWGTARIQQGICNLPDYALKSVRCVQGVKLTMETINNVLERNCQNGYLNEYKRWKFFGAKYPDELWSLGIFSKRVTTLGTPHKLRRRFITAPRLNLPNINQVVTTSFTLHSYGRHCFDFLFLLADDGHEGLMFRLEDFSSLRFCPPIYRLFCVSAFWANQNEESIAARGFFWFKARTTAWTKLHRIKFLSQRLSS